MGRDPASRFGAGLNEAEVPEAVGEAAAWEEVAPAWDRAGVREALH